MVVKCTVTLRQHRRSGKSRVDTRRGAVKANLNKMYLCKKYGYRGQMGISEERSSWSFEDSQYIYIYIPLQGCNREQEPQAGWVPKGG